MVWDYRSVAALAGSQHGAVSRAQLETLGVTRRQLDWRVKRGEWVRLLPHVFRMQASTGDGYQRAWASVLWAGSEAFVSHRAAAWCWGILEKEPQPVELTAAFQLVSPVLWVVAHRATVPKRMRRFRQGLPLTCPSRTLVDLAGVLKEEAFELAMERAFRRRLSSPNELRGVLAVLPQSGKKGTGLVGKLLQTASAGALAENDFETKALRLFRKHRLPSPVCQFHVEYQGLWLGKVDFAWPKWRLLIEADSFEHHSGREAWDSDLERYNALTLAGWTVVRLTWTDVTNENPALIAALRRKLR